MGGENFRVRLMEAPKCPVLIYTLRRSGKHSPFYKPCGYWRCKSCGNSMLQKMAMHVADKTRTLDYLHQLDVPSEQSSAIRKSLQRAEISSLRIRFNSGDLLVFSEREVKGRGWSSQALDRIDVLDNIAHRPNPADVKRHDYTLDWQTNPIVKDINSDPVLYSCVVGTLDTLRRKLQNVGVELETEFVLNPHEIADKLANA